MKLNKNNAGLLAEQMAATFLKQHGLKLVAQNYHCRYGEIDLIMKEDEVLVFVEVRLRTNQHYGFAAESISPKKQQKIIQTAQHFLMQHGEQACRFDAILMDKADQQHIEWIRHAFET
jgi:putative endonuclease